MGIRARPVSAGMYGSRGGTARLLPVWATYSTLERASSQDLVTLSRVIGSVWLPLGKAPHYGSTSLTNPQALQMTRATSVEDYKLYGSFEAVRKTLLDPQFADRWDKPLAYWALPGDRRLPLAFLGRTVGEIVNTPFETLCATPGIGQKKIQSLIKLLMRATKDVPAILEVAAPRDTANVTAQDQNDHCASNDDNQQAAFDPEFVSEALWGKWRETVLHYRLEREWLGRLAPSLQHLPTVIWRTPLGFYSERSLNDIRSLKTHGEKRVRVVLEVFFVINKMVSGASPHEGLALRLIPQFVADLEHWIAGACEQDAPPSVEDIREHVARPLVEQVRIDAGPSIFDLAQGRLGMGEEPQNVRAQARRLGVTRARVYQLLDECGKIMAVRWPEGRYELRSLQEKLAGAGELEAMQFCRRVRQLFFPDKTTPLQYDDELDE